MTKLLFFFTAVLMLLKLAAIGPFAAMSWYWVLAPAGVATFFWLALFLLALMVHIQE